MQQIRLTAQGNHSQVEIHIKISKNWYTDSYKCFLIKPISYLKTQDGTQFHVSYQKRQENIIFFQSKLEIQF